MSCLRAGTLTSYVFSANLAMPYAGDRNTYTNPCHMVLSHDGTIIAVGYRRHPLSAWETDGRCHIGHCRRQAVDESKARRHGKGEEPEHPGPPGAINEGTPRNRSKAGGDRDVAAVVRSFQPGVTGKREGERAHAKDTALMKKSLSAGAATSATRATMPHFSRAVNTE